MAHWLHTWKVQRMTPMPSGIEQLGLKDRLDEIECGGALLMRLTKKEVIVYYSCDCGAEKVERI